MLPTAPPAAPLVSSTFAALLRVWSRAYPPGWPKSRRSIAGCPAVASPSHPIRSPYKWSSFGPESTQAKAEMAVALVSLVPATTTTQVHEKHILSVTWIGSGALTLLLTCSFFSIKVLPLYIVRCHNQNIVKQRSVTPNVCQLCNFHASCDWWVDKVTHIGAIGVPNLQSSCSSRGYLYDSG